MATITGLTADRMLEIEGQSVVGGHITNEHLILEKYDGTTIDAGSLPPGPQGPIGPVGGLIPGEMRIWPGDELPPAQQFGKWVWADGGVYEVALYPEAAENIAVAWRTFAGASDPPSNLFRVPDMRGLTPVGMDAMPQGGARANRLTRSVSIILAGKSGEEVHNISIPEMPVHNHPVTDPGHYHQISLGLLTYHVSQSVMMNTQAPGNGVYTNQNTLSKTTGITVGNNGSGAGHENMQPSVFVPYIVKLDD